MEMQIGAGKVRIEKGELRLFRDGLETAAFTVTDLLFWSSGKQWEAGTHRWLAKAVDAEEKKTGEDGPSEREPGIKRLRFQDGAVLAELSFYKTEEGLRLTLTFQNCGEETLYRFAGGIRFPVREEGRRDKLKVTLPHVLYNDNPSASPDRVVPHIGNRPGDGMIAEEHRLPIPAVNLEWREKGEFYFLTLFSIPEVKTGEDEDYWSLGILREEECESLCALSGPLMFQGIKDVVYGGRCTPLPWQSGYRTLRPGDKIGKSFLLNWGAAEGEGKGFRDLAKTGCRLYRPRTREKYGYADLIALKKQVLDSRWYDDGEACGYLCFGAANSFGNISGRPEYFLYGWTGQALKLSWCDCLLGLKTGEERRLSRGLRAADFFLRNSAAGSEGLFFGYYLIEEKKWKNSVKSADSPVSSRIFGEAADDACSLVLLLKRNKITIPDGWEDRLRKALDYLSGRQHVTADGLYPEAWKEEETEAEAPAMCDAQRSVTASGMSCVLALAGGYEAFGEERFLRMAMERYESYAHIHMDTFEIPFAGATMDASCEDKEAGIYFFLAAARIHRLTGLERYKQWADICADWLLTFVFFWETGFRSGSVCSKNQFSTTGWPGVSVQNHHLDVFFPAYELYEYGRRTGQERFERMGRNVRNALTYGVCEKPGDWGFDVPGEQGEHYYHTNYFQARYPSILKHTGEWRGGMNRWNPSWITAQVLSANLKFYYESENGGARDREEVRHGNEKD